MVGRQAIWYVKGLISANVKGSLLKAFNAYDHRHWPTTCYHDFAQSSASKPFLMLVCLLETECRKTYAQNLTSQTFGIFSKVIILVLHLIFVNCYFNQCTV